MNLFQVIKHLYPELEDDKDFVLYDDGTGVRIYKWNTDKPQPTEEEINSTWSEIGLKMAKDEKIAELDRLCNATILGTFEFQYTDGNTYLFWNDVSAQANFDKLLNAFTQGMLTTPIMWTAYDSNNNVVRLSFDSATFLELYKAHLGHIQNSISKFRDVLQPQVEACTTIDDVNTITWDSI